MTTFRGFVRAVGRAQRAAARAEAARLRVQRQALREAEKQRKAAERARIADEKEKARLYTESRIEETNHLNTDLEQQVSSLKNLLASSLHQKVLFTLDSLIKQPQVPTFKPGKLAEKEAEPQKASYMPVNLGLLKYVPGMKEKHAQKIQHAEEQYKKDLEAYRKRETKRKQLLAEAQEKHDEETKQIIDDTEKQNQEVRELQKSLSPLSSEAITTYFSLAFDSVNQPEEFPLEIKFAYLPESKQLVIEYDLPPFEIVPEVAAYKYTKATDKITNTPASATTRKALYASVIAQETLRVINILFQLDININAIDTLVFNGYVNTIDKGTGKPTRPCLITVRTTKDTFSQLDLSKVDPIACLKNLNASLSKSPAELAPVRPVLEFNMVDPRFIQETDVISELDKRPNLMELTPQEFESLISNLFEKMGLETRLTQASRDGGVDCVAYDPRPIFGGKVVIQAKRYKNTVGVSAVRDLFGTVQNEGASKGILVATSGYGKAAFDFAEGKPLELLSGSNLLYLLKTHAGIDATIKVPDDWKEPTEE